MSTALGDKLKRYRVSQGLSQKEMAARFEVAQQAWQQWESGRTKPGPSNMVRIAGSMGVEVAELFDGDEDSVEVDERLAALEASNQALMEGQAKMVAELRRNRQEIRDARTVLAKLTDLLTELDGAEDSDMPGDPRLSSS